MISRYLSGETQPTITEEMVTLGLVLEMILVFVYIGTFHYMFFFSDNLYASSVHLDKVKIVYRYFRQE